MALWPPAHDPFAPKEPTAREGICVVCKGKITETFYKKYDPASGPPIIGPGSRGQYYTASSGLSCQDCGIKYAKLPK